MQQQEMGKVGAGNQQEIFWKETKSAAAGKEKEK